MRTISKLSFGALTLGTALVASNAFSGGPPLPGQTGFAGVYGNIPPDQAEFLTTPDRIKAVAVNGAPTEIWEALEHGERIECLDCIPAVAPLLYDQSSTTREIAAWWLRRRIFGVFGPGEVYQQTLNTLATDSDATRRGYAAHAVGEFFVAAGIPAVAQSLLTDSDAGVRATSAWALGRLNDDGNFYATTPVSPAPLAKAFTDVDPTVSVAALKAAGRINAFADVTSVTAALGNQQDYVRRQAVELLDEMVAKDTAAPVLSLAQNDPSVDVRIGACHALGNFHDATTRAGLQNIQNNDTSSLVRDAAYIALLRL